MERKALQIICKDEKISCSGTTEELRKRILRHYKNLEENKNIIKGKFSPKKYYTGLSEKEVEEILEEYDFNEEDFKKEYKKVKGQLMRLTYDKNYISSLTGETSSNLFDMASNKLKEYIFI